MLYAIGPVVIDTFPLSTTAVDRQDGADFAVHDLLGRRKGREHVGDGDDFITMRGSILPFRPMLDGRRELEMLRGAMKSGEPQLVMRGDGRNMGWYVVESLNETHEHACFENYNHKKQGEIAGSAAGKTYCCCDNAKV